MADIAKKTKRYPSDLTDEEWEVIAPLIPPQPFHRLRRRNLGLLRPSPGGGAGRVRWSFVR